MLERIPSMKFSISFTTRPSRQGEVNGKQYHFVTRETFKEMIKQNEFIEWAEVHGNLYGTSSRKLEEMLSGGHHALIEIDTQGASQIKKSGIEATFVFVLPPSMDELRQRLVDRKTDSEEVIERRLKNAEAEIAQKDRYDYRVVNDELERVTDELEEIVRGVIGG